MAESLIFSATHVESRRSVIVMNEGSAVWAYLTAASSTTPVADCWLLNLIDAPTTLKEWRDSANVPPVTRAYLMDPQSQPLPATEALAATWSGDGEAVAVWVDQQMLGFIVAAQPHGYSRGLTAAGPFGQPLDDGLASALFGR